MAENQTGRIHNGNTYTLTLEDFRRYMETVSTKAASTVNQYARAIDEIHTIEQQNLSQMAATIDNLLQKYGVGGENEQLGTQWHNVRISALQEFQRFITFLQNTNS